MRPSSSSSCHLVLALKTIGDSGVVVVLVMTRVEAGQAVSHLPNFFQLLVPETTIGPLHYLIRVLDIALAVAGERCDSHEN